VVEKKRYLVDGVPMTASELIRFAKDVDPRYKPGIVFFTSEAAAIIRKTGATVRENPEAEIRG
jgi:hypothetical protein